MQQITRMQLFNRDMLACVLLKQLALLQGLMEAKMENDEKVSIGE